MIQPDWQRYEMMKREWVASHPGATPQQHEAAMLRIARICGV